MYESIDELLREAKSALKNSYSPYSHFSVGAAIRTEDGKVFTGTNIENASFSLTMCAERVAAFKAISAGYKSFTDLAIVSSSGAPHSTSTNGLSNPPATLIGFSKPLSLLCLAVRLISFCLPVLLLQAVLGACFSSIFGDPLVLLNIFSTARNPSLGLVHPIIIAVAMACNGESVIVTSFSHHRVSCTNGTFYHTTLYFPYW